LEAGNQGRKKTFMNFGKLFRDWQDVTEHKAGETIYSAGDPAEFLYIVLSGEVHVELQGEKLETAQEGGVIGEMAMIKSARQSASAIAANEVKLARLDRNNLKKIIKGSNGFSLHVMAALARRLKAVDEYISKQIRNRTH
jgi:CRP-like cAMP-binding protein